MEGEWEGDQEVGGGGNGEWEGDVIYYAGCLSNNFIKNIYLNELTMRTIEYLLRYDLKLVILPYSPITNLKADTFTHRGKESSPLGALGLHSVFFGCFR